VPLSKPDKRYKYWCKCTRCYAQRVLGSSPSSSSSSSAPDPHGAASGPDTSQVPGPRPAADGPAMVADVSGSLGIIPEVSATTPQSPAPPLSKRGRHGAAPGSAQPSSGSATLQPAPQSSLPPVPPLPAPAGPPHQSQEPLRALNLYLQPLGVTPTFSETLLDDATGAWSCEARACGFSARASGQGKKGARRAAAAMLLGDLQQSAAM